MCVIGTLNEMLANDYTKNGHYYFGIMVNL